MLVIPFPVSFKSHYTLLFVSFLSFLSLKCSELYQVSKTKHHLHTMLRRTIPAVSFTVSHSALMMKPSRPLLGEDMHSSDRFKASWDEIPMTLLGASFKERYEWHWRCMYQLGLRDVYRFTKLRTVMNWVALLVFLYIGYVSFFFASVYHVYYMDWPEQFKRENAREYALAHGGDVYAGDGKFIRPYFHINPPMFTMTVEEM